MNKLLTLAAFAAAVSVQAASIDWSITGKGTAYDYTGSSALSSTVYLLVGDLSSLSGNTTESEFLTALNALKLDDTYGTSDGKKPDVGDVVITSDKITGTGNQTFSMLVYTKDSDGNGYYKIAIDSNTGYATGASADAHTTIATSWTDMRNSDWVSAWTKQDDPGPGPQPDVPEPATGALALAGVALLFKRRRA